MKTVAPHASPGMVDQDSATDYSPVRVISAIADLILATAFLVTWITPMAFLPRAVTLLMFFMLYECIIVQSASILGLLGYRSPLSPNISKPLKAALFLFFVLIALGSTLVTQAWWPLVLVPFLAFNRLFLVLWGKMPERAETMFIRRGWLVLTLLYVGLGTLTQVIPVPTLGITSEVLEIQNLEGAGAWIQQPHRIIAFGFLYFFTVGLAEIFSHIWLPGEAPSAG